MLKKIFCFLMLLNMGSLVVFAQAPIQPDQVSTKLQQPNAVTAILGAFPPEVEILRTQIKDRRENVFQNIIFTEGLLNGKKVVLAQTGIGKANAASTTALMLEHFNPAQLIFTGIAGGVNPLLQPGDIVIGTRIAYHDYGTLMPDSMLRRATRNPFTMLENPEYFISDPNLVSQADSAGKTAVFEKVKNKTPQILKGIIVTGDVFVASDIATKNLWQTMQADATEMEGAAVAQVCWQQQVPFIVIRSLSDNANNNASDDVKTFYQLAARNSAALVVAIVGILAKQ